MAGDSIGSSDGRNSGLARAILKLAKRGLSVVEELVLVLLVLLFLLLMLMLPLLLLLLQTQSSRPLVAVQWRRGPPTERRPHLRSQRPLSEPPQHQCPGSTRETTQTHRPRISGGQQSGQKSWIDSTEWTSMELQARTTHCSVAGS